METDAKTPLDSPIVELKTLQKINNSIAESDKKNGPIVALYANAFGIPYWGLVMYQDKPYINTLGLEWKWAQYPDALKFMSTEILSLYEKTGENQIAIVKITGGSPTRGVESQVGTSSSMNTNASMAKYPNEMAETRAKNRILRRALLSYFYRDFYNNIVSLGKKGEALLKSGKVSDVLSVSFEELSDVEDNKKTQPVILSNAEHKVIASYLEELASVKTEEDLDKITNKIKSDLTLNEKQKAKLRQVRINVLEKLG